MAAVAAVGVPGAVVSDESHAINSAAGRPPTIERFLAADHADIVVALDAAQEHNNPLMVESTDSSLASKVAGRPQQSVWAIL
jgi:hypothetical protein